MVSPLMLLIHPYRWLHAGDYHDTGKVYMGCGCWVGAIYVYDCVSTWNQSV